MKRIACSCFSVLLLLSATNLLPCSIQMAFCYQLYVLIPLNPIHTNSIVNKECTRCKQMYTYTIFYHLSRYSTPRHFSPPTVLAHLLYVCYSFIQFHLISYVPRPMNIQKRFQLLTGFVCVLVSLPSDASSQIMRWKKRKSRNGKHTQEKQK